MQEDELRDPELSGKGKTDPSVVGKIPLKAFGMDYDYEEIAQLSAAKVLEEVAANAAKLIGAVQWPEAALLGAAKLTDTVNLAEVAKIGGLLGQWVKTHAPVNQIRDIEALAETVLDDKQQAFKWLSEPNPATDDKPPIDLLGDQSGYDRVKNLLLRIEYGVLA